MKESYEKLLEKFKKWGMEKDDIRAINIAGSYAYFDRRTYDQWSDIDLAIYSNNPRSYRNNTEWLNHIHSTEIIFETDFFGNKDLPVLRVQFINHLEADIGILPIEMLNIEETTEDVLKIIHMGTKILIDKDGLLKNAIDRYLKTPLPQVMSNTKQQMESLLNEFAIGIIHSSKKIARGDIYFAYFDMTSYLAEMINNFIFLYHEMKYGRIKILHDNLKNYKYWSDEFIQKGLVDLYPSCNKASLWKSMENHRICQRHEIKTGSSRIFTGCRTDQ